MWSVNAWSIPATIVIHAASAIQREGCRQDGERQTGAARRGHGAITRRSAGPPRTVHHGSSGGEAQRPGLRRAPVRVAATGDDDHVGATALDPAERQRERPRVSGGEDEDRGPRARRSGGNGEQPVEGHGGVGGEPGEEVQHALRLARRRRDRDPRDARLRARVARGEEPEREPPVRELAHHRRGDDIELLDLFVGEAELPAGPSDVCTSSATSSSRSRDGSKRLSIGWLRRALVRAWTRRTGSPGAYGRTPANRDGSSARPMWARSWSPQRSVGASSVVGITRGQTRNVSVSSRSSMAARRANGSPTESSTGPSVWTPRRSALTWNRRMTRSYGRSVHALRSIAGFVSSVTRSRSRTSMPGLVSSSARSQARGSRRWFQTSIESGSSSPNATCGRAELAAVADAGEAVAGPRGVDNLEQQRDVPRRIAIGTPSRLPSRSRTSAERTRAATISPGCRSPAGPGWSRGPRRGRRPRSPRAGCGRG